jgi:hypothetical protein
MTGSSVASSAMIRYYRTFPTIAGKTEETPALSFGWREVVWKDVVAMPTGLGIMYEDSR